MEPDIRLYNTDVESFMAKLPDNHFDIAIADPPYGIGRDWKRRRRAAQLYDDSGYNNLKPSKKVIDEIVRSHC